MISERQDKKTRLFMHADGKCEYCGIDMMLCYKTPKIVPDNMATLEHKYSRDHPLRNEHTEEKRQLIVCNKCNGEKSGIEPNHNTVNNTEKMVKRIVPKVKWTDEIFMAKISDVVDQIRNRHREIAVIDNEMARLKQQKVSHINKICKAEKYKNLLINEQKNMLING